MSWQAEGACVGMPVAIWFEPIPSYESRARWLCRDCTCRARCLDEAITNGELLGIRGGLTPAERMGLQPVLRDWSRRKHVPPSYELLEVAV